MAPTQNQQPSGNLTILLSHGSVSATSVTVSLTSDIRPEDCLTVSGPRSTAMVARARPRSTLRGMNEFTITKRSEYVPSRIDLVELQRLVDERLAEASAPTRPYDWSAWVAFCESIQADPFNAHFDDFVAFLAGGRTRDGRLYCFASLEAILVEVRRRYALLGKTPAFLLPENKATWRTVKTARRRKEVRETKKAPPVSSEHAEAMIRAKPESTTFDLIRGVAFLIALDLGWHSHEISSLRWEDVRLEAESAQIRGVTVSCDHRQRVPGLPHDCLPCWLRNLNDATKPLQGSLVTYDRSRITRMLRAVADYLPGLIWEGASTSNGGTTGGIKFVDPSTRRKRAIIRRTAILCVGYPSGLIWVRDRAWAAMTYACGLRMASDFSRLSRRAISPCTQERGWRLALGQCKNDPAGDRGDLRIITERRSPLVFGALNEYLLIRDFLVPEGQGPLILAGTQSCRPRLSTTPPSCDQVRDAAGRAVQRLSALANLSKSRYSPYSLRRGYACHLERSGRDLLFIQEALRHTDPNTTMGYLSMGAGTRAAVHALMEKVS